MQSKAPTIAAYIAELPVPEKVVIQAFDRLVRSSLDHAVATMKFGMPTYEVDGRMIAINAQKKYFSLYVDPAVIQRYRAELKNSDCGKCCIRFRRIEDLRVETVRSIIVDQLSPKGLR